ncbi:hypothetical protein M7784_13470 [Desulfovibrio aminophilus]|nr:hypothetical protein [Desulfovibrio aminophilus]MCM0756243.1 hypothetical protein [Desulfovibrio aminophilus]
MRHFVLLVLLLAVASPAWALEPGVAGKEKPRAESVQADGPGCCRFNGGVCGCRGGRVVCCDRTLSTSCHCFRDETSPAGPPLCRAAELSGSLRPR